MIEPDSTPKNIETRRRIELPDGYLEKYILLDRSSDWQTDIVISKARSGRNVLTLTKVHRITYDQQQIYTGEVESLYEINDPSDRRGSKHLLFTNDESDIKKRFEVRVFPSGDYEVRSGDVSGVLDLQ